MNAIEARQKAEVIVKLRTERELKSILSSIEQAAGQGQFSLEVEHTALSTESAQILRKPPYGYKILQVSNGDYNVKLVIKW